MKAIRNVGLMYRYALMTAIATNSLSAGNNLSGVADKGRCLLSLSYDSRTFHFVWCGFALTDTLRYSQYDTHS